MSTFRSYIMDTVELTHSVVYMSFDEDQHETATIYSDDDNIVLCLSDEMPWGDMLQEFKEHTLH